MKPSPNQRALENRIVREKMIEVNGLTKVYKKGVRALNSIDLKVNTGEIYGLLGPNGAGKTTTIKILTTLLQPTGGQVLINSYNLLKEKNKIRKILGCVFQDTIVDEMCTGYENMYLHGALCNIRKRELKKRIKTLSVMLELDSFLDKLVSSYSGGMKRKLDIAIALINNPKILYLDEPSLGLDPSIRRKLWEYINNLNKEMGITILLTTHYLDEADNLCDRIAIINKGEIVIEGRPNDLKKEIEGDIVEICFSEDCFKNMEDSKNTIMKELSKEKQIKDVKFMDHSMVVYCRNFEKNLLNISRIIQSNGLFPSSIVTSVTTLDDVFIKYTGSHFKN